MKTRMTFFMLAGLALAGLAGCGSGHDDPGGVSSLELRLEPADPNAAASCKGENGGCTCPDGARARLTLVAHAGDGSEVAVDPGGVTWGSGDAASVEVVADGDGADVAGRRDWFDAGGSEPTATVTASYAGMTASMPVTVAINAAGDWQARLDNGFTYLLSLRQAGRDVTDASTGYGGRIAGNALSLAVSGINVNATFSSRTQVDGTYAASSGGLHGTLTCTRQ